MYKNLITICVSLLIIFVSIQIEFSLGGRSRQSYLDIPRFKAFYCEFTDEMLELMYHNETCNVSKIDGRQSGINLYIAFKNPTDHIYVNCSLFFKSDGKFREVVSLPEFDWCLLTRKKYDGFLLQQLAEMAKRLLPTIISNCPREMVTVSNLTFPSHKFFSFLPTGFYKFVAKIRFDDKGPYLYNMIGEFLFESYKDKMNH